MKNLKVYSVKKEGVRQIEKDYFRDVLLDDRYTENITGERNNYLQYVIKTIHSSPTGSRCLKVLKDFIKGNGFNLKSLYTRKINKTERFKQLHNKVASDFAYSNRFALLVGREIKDGKIVNTELQHLPVEWVRYTVPNEEGITSTIKYNPYFNTTEEFSGFASAQTEEWNIYESNESIALKNISEFNSDINNYNKKYYEVYFHNDTNEVDRTYGKPLWFESGENVFITEGKAWRFHQRNISNNFFSGGILELEGNPDEPITNENGDIIDTLGQSTVRELHNNLAGEDNAGAIMVMWKSGDSNLNFVPFVPNDNDSKLLDIMTQARTAIPTIMAVSPLLIGIETAGKLGDSKEKEGAIKFQNENTEEYRWILGDVYSELLGEEIEILPIEEYIMPPDFIWETLSTEQRSNFVEQKMNTLNYNFDNNVVVPLIVEPVI